MTGMNGSLLGIYKSRCKMFSSLNWDLCMVYCSGGVRVDGRERAAATVVNSVYTVATPKVQNFNRAASQSGIARLADSSLLANCSSSKILPFKN